MGPYGSLSVLKGPYRSLWFVDDPYGSLLVLMDLYGSSSIWVFMGPYGLRLEVGLEMWIVHWQRKCYICYSSATCATRVLHSLLETVTLVT